MAISNITEEQVNHVLAFIEATRSPRMIDSNVFLGKCAEIAVQNFGYNNKIFQNQCGPDLSRSILNPKNHADNGCDIVVQSFKNKYHKINLQIKSTDNPIAHNIPLSKNLYDEKLEYYNYIPQDVFVFVKKISDASYDIIGFIEHDEAIEVMTQDDPINGCYCINEKFLHPFEQIETLLEK